MKNLYTPTPAQAKYRNRLWADALILNKKKTRHQMTDGCGGRCCLAVAEDVAGSCGVTIEESNGQHWTPCHATVCFFGWSDNNPDLFITKTDSSNSAAEINDEYTYEGEYTGLPHRLIAKAVMNTFVHPKDKKNIFK